MPKIYDLNAVGEVKIKTLTFPASAVGYLFCDENGIMSWDAAATPEAAGSDKQIQFNDGGTMGADSGLRFDKNYKSLSIDAPNIDAGSFWSSGPLSTYYYYSTSTDEGESSWGWLNTVVVSDGVTHQMSGIEGAWFDIQYAGSGGCSWVNGLEIDLVAGGGGTVGFVWGIDCCLQPGKAANVLEMIGFRGSVSEWFESAAGGTISNAYYIQLKAPGYSGAGAITNHYGLYIENQTDAAVSGNNYNLYSAGYSSKNLFQGTLYLEKNISGAKTFEVVGVITKTDTGDPAYGYEGLLCINTFDNNVKIYGDSGWRTIASGW